MLPSFISCDSEAAPAGFERLAASQLRLISMPKPPRPYDEGVERVVLGLRTRGCALFAKGRGCTHCGLVDDPIWDATLSDEAILENFVTAFRATHFRENSTVCVYVAGSFFDDHELSPAARREVLKIVASEPRIARLSIESRPGYITEARAAEAADIMAGKKVEVGIGFDSANDEIRNKIVGKGTTIGQHQRAVRHLHDQGIRALLYALVKPPYLTEAESLEDTCETVRQAFDMGADAVSLEPLAVQKGVPLMDLYTRGEFKPPWLWTIVEVVRRTHALGELRVGGNVVFPPPVAVAENCPKCSATVREALQQFDRTQHFAQLDALTCACLADWHAELEARPRAVA